jgi:hypothetical protein
MHQDKRQAVLATLREIYDGRLDRHLGTDGGLTLSWSGKAGFLGGCTEAVDCHHAVRASMGERLLLFRMPQLPGEEVAMFALEHSTDDAAMRKTLEEAVSILFEGFDIPREPGDLSKSEMKWLSALADFIVKARSTSIRDNYTREPQVVPGSEAPPRLVKALAQLGRGLDAIGVEPETRRMLIEKVAFDNLPVARMRLIRALEAVTGPVALVDFDDAIACSRQAMRRHLEDLRFYGIVTGHGGGQGKKDFYQLTTWARSKLESIRCSPEPPN